MPRRKPTLKRTADQDKLTSKISDASSPQPTIFQHFSLSKHNHTSKSEEVSSQLPNKRPKLEDHPLPGNITASTGLEGRRIRDNMYTFANDSAGRAPSIIDLTKSFDRSDARPQLSGGARPTSFNLSRTPRTLVVKNLKKPSGPSPEQYYDNVWTKLDTSLTAIFHQTSLPHSKEVLYKEVMILCQQNSASRLLNALTGKLKTHVEQGILAQLQTEVVASSCEHTLPAVVKAWDTWITQLEIIRAIFYFLDRSYVLRQNLPSIETIGVRSFTKSIVQNPNLQIPLLDGICDLITKSRSSSSVRLDDQNLIPRAVRMLIRQGVYGESFEPKILAETTRYYSQWSENAVASNTLAGYISMCERTLTKEKNFATQWALDPATSKQIEIYLEDILIEGQKDQLCNVQNVGELLMHNESSLLRQLFLLLQRKAFGEDLKPAFEEHITSSGATIIFDEDREDEMVTRLLSFKQQLYSLWEEAFMRNVVLRNALRGAFESFMNKTKRSNMNWGTDNSKPGEMIAKYVDKVLKSGSKAVKTPSNPITNDTKMNDHDRQESDEDEDVEIGKQLDEVLDLFRFVHGKAVFEAFYKRDLARRLLLGRSASSDAEKSMLTRLKAECGAGFTHNLEQMFKDIETARDEINSYKAMLEERGAKPSFDLSVNVLSSAAWPSYPDVVVNVPEDVLKATAKFEQYFKVNHSGRKLEWKHALAHCQLRSIFPKGTKEIVVSSFQAITLLSFNGAESLSYEDLKASTGLDDNELKRTLQSLACANYRVLNKSPKGKEVDAGDRFSVNLTFHHPKYRIKINQIQAKETRQENKQTHERIAIDRKYETQAAIVRIMKGRKSITHAELVSETIIATRTRGPLDPADIKTQIETLIEKDYMERDEEEQNTYTYVA